MKKINLVHYFDMFEAQTEGVYKRHCKVPPLIFLHRDVTALMKSLVDDIFFFYF